MCLAKACVSAVLSEQTTVQRVYHLLLMLLYMFLSQLLPYSAEELACIHPFTAFEPQHCESGADAVCALALRGMMPARRRCRETQAMVYATALQMSKHGEL